MQIEIIKGIHYKTNEPISIEVEGEKIKNIYKVSKQEVKNGGYENYIAPGLVDLQINGFKGIDFNKNPLSLDEWENVTYELAKHGITSFYPTIITNSYENLKNIFHENYKVLAKKFNGSNLVKGFHLEGPYISSEDGPRGAHNEEDVRGPDTVEFDNLQSASGNMLNILTMSPEWASAPNFIHYLLTKNIVVALGHLNASENEINLAVQSGARFSTHLGNGTHPHLPRHNNYVLNQLANDELYASVIADGHHLPVNLLKIFNRVKKEKMFLVSDSVSLAGREPGDYETAVGGKVTLTEDNKLHLFSNPNILAGSASSLIEGVNFLFRNDITSLSEAIEKASIVPAKVMGLSQKNGLSEDNPADLIVFNKGEEAIELLKTIKHGKVIYNKNRN